MLLYLLPSWPRWSETFLRQDLAFLQKEGVDLLPVALFHGDCDAEPDWPKVEVLSQKAIPAQEGVRARLPLPPCVALLLSRWKHRALRKRMLALVQQERITHIHAEFAGIAALIACEVAHKAGIPFSVGIHAADVFHLKYPACSLFRDVSFVLACNNAAAQALGELWPDLNERIHRIPHGVDLDFWKFLPALPRTGNLVFIGRLVPKKGLSLLFRALALLPQEIALTVVGDGPLRRELALLAETLAISRRIIWRGRLTREGVRDALRQASALVMPSVVDADGNRDGIPNAITEAMATGVPVIGSRNGGLAEVLTEETGWPYGQDAPESLAEAILACLRAPHHAERRRLRARALMEQSFDAGKCSAERAALFRRNSSTFS